MTKGLTITKQVRFRSGKRGRKAIEEGAEAKTPDLGRVPRVSRLMALAIHMDDLIRRGEVADYAELARLAHVTRARMTHIMSLLHLAPDIQEELLGLPRSKTGHDPIREKMVRPIAAVPDWRKQRRLWGELRCPRLARFAARDRRMDGYQGASRRCQRPLGIRADADTGGKVRLDRLPRRRPPRF